MSLIIWILHEDVCEHFGVGVFRFTNLRNDRWCDVLRIVPDDTKSCYPLLFVAPVQVSIQIQLDNMITKGLKWKNPACVQYSVVLGVSYSKVEVLVLPNSPRSFFTRISTLSDGSQSVESKCYLSVEWNWRKQRVVTNAPKGGSFRISLPLFFSFRVRTGPHVAGWLEARSLMSQLSSKYSNDEISFTTVSD